MGSLTVVDYETLQCTVDADGVALLTLSRPDQLNAFTVTMARELEQFFTVDAYDDAIRASGYAEVLRLAAAPT